MLTVSVSLSFNPCSNGMKKEHEGKEQRNSCFRFNPCSNGMKKEPIYASGWMEFTRFNPCSNGMKKELMIGGSVSLYFRF